MSEFKFLDLCGYGVPFQNSLEGEKYICTSWYFFELFGV